jgi:hypothetical protein
MNTGLIRPFEGSSMQVPEPAQQSSGSPGSLRLIRWSSLVATISGVLTLGLVSAQHHWQVLHPHYLPSVILLSAMAVGAMIALVSGLWRMARGPRRFLAFGWTLLALLPLVFWSYVGLYAMACWRDRWVPNDLPMNLAKVLGATLMRLEASIEYPNRLETGRLVMFYKGLDEPQRDAEAMDRHLARMETMLGGKLRGRVFWVRGRLPRLGLGGLSTHGMALGSDRSPEDWRGHGGLDRHELAHAALDQFRSPGADPPYVLHEGWAESQSGVSSAELARDALGEHSRVPTLGLRDLLGPSWYHRDLGPVYPIGGALVDFVIREHGIERFLRLYNGCRPETFDAICREVFDKDIEALEAEFWRDARQQVSVPPDRQAKGTGP